MKNHLISRSLLSLAIVLIATVAKAGIPQPPIADDPICMDLKVNVYGEINPKGEMASIIEVDGTNECGTAMGMVYNRKQSTIRVALKRDIERPSINGNEFIAGIKFELDDHTQKLIFTVDKSGVATMKPLKITNREKM